MLAPRAWVIYCHLVAAFGQSGSPQGPCRNRQVTAATSALSKHSELALGMHSLRRRVFKDRLDWTVSVSAGLEIDQYDLLAPNYLLVLKRREVIGCVRLLPTTGANMLANTFSILLDGRPAPADARIWESSRFCVDTQKADATAENGLRHATFLLFAAMIDGAGIAAWRRSQRSPISGWKESCDEPAGVSSVSVSRARLEPPKLSRDFCR
jgi:Autoinducer synthase